MKVDITRAENIAGWMTHQELSWLAKQARSHERIIEIGSYQGRSTRALAENTKGIVVAIDDFAGPRDIGLPDAIKESLFELFSYNMVDLVEMGKVIPVLSDHKNINIDFSPDMVFLDGSHEYEDVKFDILLWWHRLVPGGLLCGHDFTNMFGVQAAVKELIKGFKVVRGTSIWYAKKTK